VKTGVKTQILRRVDQIEREFAHAPGRANNCNFDGHA
jgi:hypothetical protein